MPCSNNHRTPPLKYDELRGNGLCTEAATPQPNPNPRLPDLHSEEILLGQWPGLWNALCNNKNLESSIYDIFLYSFKSPCPDCASKIVNAVNKDRFYTDPHNYRSNGGTFYITFTEEYISRNRPNQRTLPQTMNTFQAFNRRLPRNLIVMYNCPQGQGCGLIQPRLGASKLWK